MKSKLVLTALFIAVFGTLIVFETSKAESGVYAFGTSVLPTPSPTPTPITNPITSPVTSPLYILSGNVSLRVFNLIKGWIVTPAVNVAVVAYNAAKKEAAILITDKNGNYSGNFAAGAYNVNSPTIFGYKFAPTAYFVNLKQNTGGLNFTGVNSLIGK